MLWGIFVFIINGLRGKRASRVHCKQRGILTHLHHSEASSAQDLARGLASDAMGSAVHNLSRAMGRPLLTLGALREHRGYPSGGVRHRGAELPPRSSRIPDSRPPWPRAVPSGVPMFARRIRVEFGSADLPHRSAAFGCPSGTERRPQRRRSALRLLARQLRHAQLHRPPGLR